MAALDPDPPPLSLFAHFQTMCPIMCVRYTTVALQPITRFGESERARPSMFYGCYCQSLAGGSTTPSGRLHRGCLLAAAAAPVVPTCYGRQAELLVLAADWAVH